MLPIGNLTGGSVAYTRMDPLHGAIIECEFRIAVLEALVEKLLNHANQQATANRLGIPVFQSWEIDRIKRDALERLKTKYPEAAQDMRLT